MPSDVLLPPAGLVFAYLFSVYYISERGDLKSKKSEINNCVVISNEMGKALKILH